MQHIQKVHPWLNWSIETSTKHFEEEIEALEDNYMEELEHDPMVSKQCKKTPKYPTKEWIIARFARSVTNNDVTNHVNIEKYVDIATNNAEMVANKLGKVNVTIN